MRPRHAQRQLLEAPSSAPHLSPASHAPGSWPCWVSSLTLGSADPQSATPQSATPLGARTPKCVLKLAGHREERRASVQASPALKLLHPPHRLQSKMAFSSLQRCQFQPLCPGLACAGQAWKEAEESWRMGVPRKRAGSSRRGECLNFSSLLDTLLPTPQEL